MPIVAIWSGPRNISTAMMRAWENRPDTVVWDEPMYAYYLKRTGLAHPGREEIMAAYETQLDRLIPLMTAPPMAEAAIFYQKHMTHHLAPDESCSWVEGLHNGFLIRNPREMLTSLIRVLPNPTIEETGLPQQCSLFEHLVSLGSLPPVVDARDVLEQPQTMLTLLCDALGVPFHERMLSWPAGPRKSDGIWAPHWYASVEQSTGFAPYKPKTDRVPRRLLGLLNQCEGLYQRMAQHKLQGGEPCTRPSM